MITSLQFYLILFPTLIFYWIIPPGTYLRQLVLIISSFIFIYLFDTYALIIAVSLSIYTFLAGASILKFRGKNVLHATFVICLLMLLIFFKYLGFLASTFCSFSAFTKLLPKFEIKTILLPLGLSYIILKHISYLTDIKWGLVKESNFIEFLNYSCLFTIFTAGPIERFVRLQPQVRNKGLQFEWIYIDEGFQRIVFGLFKKFALADWIAYFINPVWENRQEYSIGIRALALLGFSFQIYFDFSGYSDIAIGSSRLFGLKIMENFDYPYLKRNISQFWRAWHISLSDWIRDYIFMPLGRLSQKKVWFLFFVPVISMGICGIWHGPKWGFLIWGIWHGIGISVYKISQYAERRNKRYKNYMSIIFKEPVADTITFLYITIGWLWFI